MEMERREILEIQFANHSYQEVADILHKAVNDGQKTFVVTANPEIVMYAQDHPDYKKIIQSADLVVPDGIGIIVASRILNRPIKERVTGFDLMMNLLQEGNKNNWSIYLLGGKEEINRKAVENIQRQFPDLRMAGSHHGFFDWRKNNINEEIRAVSPDIIFVALGFPKQEKWISENAPLFSKGLFIGVGGSIDVLAGEVKRAPLFWRKANLEWLYRLLSQPSRWRRMVALPRFLWQIIKRKFH